jgi:murein DD-endopeptidase MepM/ murein hydrolase activator NlpD
VKPFRFAGLALALLITLALPVPLAADEASELEEVQRELRAVEAQIKTARTEASSIGRQVTTAQARLSEAVDEYEAAAARVAEASAQVSLTETRVSTLQGEQVTLEAQLARTKLELADVKIRLEAQAVSMYMQASALPSLNFLSQSSIAEAVTALAYAGDVFAHDDDVLASFSILKREEERQREALVARKAEAEAELTRLQEYQAALVTEETEADRILRDAKAQAAEVQGLLRQINAEIAAAEEHKDGLEADAAALQREIEDRQDPGGDAPGVLAWPINGRVVSRFGYRVHPILGIRRMHTGIDIDASTGDSIRAAESGRVILAQTYGGYGRAVVIDHGGGMATLYAHQSSLAVSVGDNVERGEVIGYAGCTGLCTGPHLHFEVRINGGFVDPMDYLG